MQARTEDAAPSEREGFRFPTREEGWGSARPYEVRGAPRGLCFGPVDTALQEMLVRWVETGELSGFEVLKAPNVVRCNELVAKTYPPQSQLARAFRRAPARRAARAYFRVLPIPSPRPLVALDRVGRHGASMLISEHVAGPHLDEAWGQVAEAVEALPAFLARMHRNGIYHGDLHPRNLIWSPSAAQGEAPAGNWVLIDIDGLRHRLHSRHRIVVGQWARLLFYLRDDAAVRAAYESYCAALGEHGEPDSMWQEILQRRERLANSRRETLEESLARHGLPRPKP